MKIHILVALALIAVSTTLGSTITCLTNNSGQCSTLAESLSVSAIGNNIQISNLGPLESAIDSLYFDPTPDDALDGILIVRQSAGVAFRAGATPSNLPSGATGLPPFGALYAISAIGPGNNNRIDVGENIVVGAANGGNLTALFSSGLVRIGLHVQSVGNSGLSEALIATGGSLTAVPESGTWALVGAGIGLLAMARRIRARL